MGAELLKFARQELLRPWTAPRKSDCPVGQSFEASFDQINLTVIVSGRVRGSKSGRGPTLTRAIEQAARKMLLDLRFGPPITCAEMRDARIELWIQTEQARVFDLAEIDLGRDGVLLRLGSAEAYYKPSVALTSAITEAQHLLEMLALKAGLEPDDWQDGDAEIFRTRWEHCTESSTDSEGILILHRMRPVGDLKPVTREIITNALLASANRLVAVQQKEGFYLYECHAFNGRSKSGPGNLVRQAGCAYAIANASGAFGDFNLVDRFRKSAISAISFLLNAIELRWNDHAAVSHETDSNWLGLISLTLAAVQHRNIQQDFLEIRNRLRSDVLFSQRADGSLRCTATGNSLTDDGIKQDFYPGEALLALALELNDGIENLDTPLEKAFEWYRKYFQMAPKSALVAWHCAAWRLVCDYRRTINGAREYADFVFEMVDWILEFQLTPATNADSEYWGSFSPLGGKPSFSTAGYIEAIVHGYDLAVRDQLRERASRYRDAAIRGFAFLLKLQICAGMKPILVSPSVSLGGTTKSLSDGTIRCDFDQHAITAYISALQSPTFLGP